MVNFAVGVLPLVQMIIAYVDHGLLELCPVYTYDDTSGSEVLPGGTPVLCESAGARIIDQSNGVLKVFLELQLFVWSS